MANLTPAVLAVNNMQNYCDSEVHTRDWSVCVCVCVCVCVARGVGERLLIN